MKIYLNLLNHQRVADTRDYLDIEPFAFLTFRNIDIEDTL